MIKIQFTIYGNQENIAGNPIPYFRQTQGSKFSKESKRYHQWQDHVRDALIVAGYNMSHFHGMPDAEVTIIIHWASEAHADADNIYKGILDSLFENDKHISCGGIHFEHAADKKGRVDVTIKFMP